jgi:demethylmenaquinone methyltransferase/2-methoxy-6-polyprenyl-1,4-benzoquinol methylase
MEPEISRVLRPRSEARANYDRLSHWYDWVSAPFERTAREHGLKLLDAQPGEAALEVGFGTGWGLLALADAVGSSGMVCGVDPSSGMLKASRKRVRHHVHSHRIKLLRGDGVALPFRANRFDAVFMSFTLELFDTPEILSVIRECKRVLHAQGRICVVSLAKSQNAGILERFYERLHASFPVTFDCRPIRVGPSMMSGGFQVVSERTSNLWGLPVSIVLATKPSPL